MILHGNARGGAGDLARHLMRDDENDHIYVHEVSGFMADDILGALHEVEALSRGTRCEKYLFSLSLSPPKGANLSSEDFERAVDKAEAALGLTGQPRVIIFHEKGDNRDRHAHAVWSRIDVAEMKAVPMPFNRLRMREVSRELFIEHGLEVPRGLIDREHRNPLNYSLGEYQHAKRVGQNAHEIKAAIQNAWAQSDNAASLSAALHERGFRLARGDRRGFVAVDVNGEPFALAKWAGVKTKAVRERLGPESSLPSLDETRAAIAQVMTRKMDQFQAELSAREEQRKQEAAHQRRQMVERQRAERAQALEQIKQRQQREVLERQARFRKGLGGVWDFLRGETRRIKSRNEREACESEQRDRAEKDRLIQSQMVQRQQWQARNRLIEERARVFGQEVRQDREQFIERREAARKVYLQRRNQGQDQSRNRLRGPER
jgi:hypothetical protein